jgi:hypothetical protein
MKKSEFIEGGIEKIQGLMVSKNSPAWKAFRFISGAKSKDQTRFHMTGIHVERAGGKTVLISTDGRRLHIAKVDTVKIDPGEYQVKENTRDFMILYPKDEGIRFPNWKTIVKNSETQKHIKIDFAEIKDKALFSQSLFKYFRATESVVNIEFLEPLAGRKWDIYFNEREKAHTFINGNLIAILMPMAFEEIAVEETVREQSPDFRDITEVKVLEFTAKKLIENIAKKARIA